MYDIILYTLKWWIFSSLTYPVKSVSYSLRPMKTLVSPACTCKYAGETWCKWYIHIYMLYGYRFKESVLYTVAIYQSIFLLLYMYPWSLIRPQMRSTGWICLTPGLPELVLSQFSSWVASQLVVHNPKHRPYITDNSLIYLRYSASLFIYIYTLYSIIIQTILDG